MNKSLWASSYAPLKVLAVVSTLILLSAGAAGQVSIQPADDLPVDVAVGTGNQAGASAGSASCDLLATACAAAVAAVVSYQVEATGMIPILGEGKIVLEGGAGTAITLMATRVIVSAERAGETAVVSHFEEDRIIPGDNCKWYNPADWLRSCEPDRTVTEQVSKTRTNACPQTDNALLNSNLVGAWRSNGCVSSAIENALCYEAEAQAVANSNSPTGSQSATASAANCDDSAAAAMFMAGVEHVSTTIAELVTNSATSNEEEGSIRTVTLQVQDLPEDVATLIQEQIRNQTMQGVVKAMESYSGPNELKEFVEAELIALVEQSLEESDGSVLAWIFEVDTSA